MKDKIMIFIFISYWVFFSLFGIVLKDKEISYTERRRLTQVPEFTLQSDYLNKLDKYLLDQFPFRDEFRALKANFNYKFLQKLDNNGIYIIDDYIFKIDNKINEKSLINFKNHIEITKSYLNEDNKVYMMIIPDKNYSLEDTNFLKLDYVKIYQELDKIKIEKIDIRDIMKLSDYYPTDTHWRQEKIEKVVKKLNEKMNFNYQEQLFTKNIYDKFYGVYYSEASVKREADKLVYLENDIINKAYVTYLENKDLHSVYNVSNLDSMDSYEVYLDGASSFIEIYNKNSLNNKELVIFRDSFASSLTPYLINSYKKITLIDNRYINSSNYKDLIEFKDQDVLFMYSTLIINNSFSLKN